MRNLQKWFYGLLAGIIGGTATAVSTTLGLSAASAVGIPVHALDLKQLAGVAIFGVISNGMLYLRTSPLPPLQTDTDFVRDFESKRGSPATAKTVS